MTVQAQFIPRNYDVFAGLDVDKKSLAVIFTDHDRLMQSLRLPYSAEQLPLRGAPATRIATKPAMRLVAPCFYPI